MNPRLILALPAYNEADNLKPLIGKARELFEGLGAPYEIIVVNDGSSDNTLAVLHEMAAVAPLSIVEHPLNLGLGAAIRSAISAALEASHSDDDIIVNMDSDDTHDPKYIPAMIEKIWGGGYDIVIASRFREGSQEVGVPLGRRILSRGARLLFQIFLRLPDVRDYTCGFRAYRASLLRAAQIKYGDRLITRQGFACTDEILVHLSTLTRRVTEIPFVLRYDKKRSPSKLPLFQTIVETIKMLIFRG